MNKIKVKNIFAAVFDKSVLNPLLEVLDKKSVKFWGTEGTTKYLKSKGFSAYSIVDGFDFDGRVKTLDRCVFVRILADRTKRKHLTELKKLAHYSSSEAKRNREVSSENLIVSKVNSRQARMISGRDWEPFDLVIVDLYEHDAKNFPESMDIGGQALIRAAIKNYKSVALAFDARSLGSLVRELVRNNKQSFSANKQSFSANKQSFSANKQSLRSSSSMIRTAGLRSIDLAFRRKQAKAAAKFIAKRCNLEAKYFK